MGGKPMFSIGEKISYPMHGAGIIEGIEEQMILETIRSYYVLRMSYGGMKVMVPVENSDEIGVRRIIDESKIQDVLSVLGSEPTPMQSNWNKRSRDNMDKLKTGDLCQIADVVRNLVCSERKKKLSTGDKKMLSNARHLLISEIVLVRNISVDEAEHLIDDSIIKEKTPA
jgi:CarD family transcriptional regulator